jgi:hypothetical protein
LSGSDVVSNGGFAASIGADGGCPGVTVVNNVALSGSSFVLLGCSGPGHEDLSGESRINSFPLSNGRFKAWDWQSGSGVGSDHSYNRMSLVRAVMIKSGVCEVQMNGSGAAIGAGAEYQSRRSSLKSVGILDSSIDRTSSVGTEQADGTRNQS